LIVDDSAMVGERLAAMLAALPEKIQVIGQAQDVPEAIQAIQALKPDAVILDIRMPGGTGLDVLQAVKKDRPDTIVMMLTNYPYPQYRRKCLEAGADFFFDKAAEMDQVPAILQQLIRDSRFGLGPSTL
jgi:DNA-binding NarL/FixJ family response regulator